MPFPVTPPPDWKPVHEVTEWGWSAEQAVALRHITYLLFCALAEDDPKREVLARSAIQHLSDDDPLCGQFRACFVPRSKQILLCESGLKNPFEAAADIGHEIDHAIHDRSPPFSIEDECLRESRALQAGIHTARSICEFLRSVPRTPPRALNTWLFVLEATELKYRMSLGTYRLRLGLLKLQAEVAALVEHLEGKRPEPLNMHFHVSGFDVRPFVPALSAFIQHKGVASFPLQEVQRVLIDVGSVHGGGVELPVPLRNELLSARSVCEFEVFELLAVRSRYAKQLEEIERAQAAGETVSQGCTH
jgi:hypothetical protein